MQKALQAKANKANYLNYEYMAMKYTNI